MVDTIELLPLAKLTRDTRNAAATLGQREARYLVDMYYLVQDYRIQANNQTKALIKTLEPHEAIGWVLDSMHTLENNIEKMLLTYAQSQVAGRWAMSICGIGPIIAAGLLAHVDIEQCPTVGHLWRFAGLDPTVEWLGTEKAKALMRSIESATTDSHVLTVDMVMEAAKRTNRKPENIAKLAGDKETGEITRGSLEKALAKRPWNADLKVICWKAGESFVKVQNNANDIYGKVYSQRKLYEQARNEVGDYAEQAAKTLTDHRYRDDTKAKAFYSKGQLPPAHIHARAKRYAVKLFLAHFHHIYYESHYGVPPPKPYILNQPNHTHFIAPPNWPME